MYCVTSGLHNYVFATFSERAFNVEIGTLIFTNIYKYTDIYIVI